MKLDISPDAAELRRCAEERLSKKRSAARPADAEADAQSLLHELEVHQIELEMQNAMLQSSRDRTEALLENDTDLYDFAPVGYLTLDREGTICEANLTSASLLGIERSRLVRRRLGLCVSVDDLPAFNAFLARTFVGKQRQYCEVAILRVDPAPLFVRIEAVVSEGQRECHAAVVDVTDRHRAEVERERLIQELQAATGLVKSLSGLLPICAGCKQIRDDKGYWKQVEIYLEEHSQATFTHGLCPKCLKKYIPSYQDEATKR